jgi:hypothetical protein
MDIQSEKLKVIEILLKTQDEAIIDQVKAILQDDQTEHWDELPAHVKKAIEIADLQIERGEVKPHEEVMTSFKKKFLK